MIFQWRKSRIKTFVFLAGLVFALMVSSYVSADVIINILSVNGTDQTKEKEISSKLPREITPEDVLDAGGLNVE